MSEPIVFISHFRIKEGGLEPYRDLQREMLRQLEPQWPRTVAFLAYLAEDGSQLTIVHVFPDAGAMDAHFAGSDERSRSAYEFLVPDGWEIYGLGSQGSIATMRREAAAAGVTLTIQPELAAGFLRTGGS
jgi:hypothetical protein